MKSLTLFALLLTGCTIRFTPTQSTQARLMEIYRLPGSRDSLIFNNISGHRITFMNKNKKGIGRTRYIIGDWYTIDHNENPVDTSIWTLARLKHNN